MLNFPQPEDLLRPKSKLERHNDAVRHSGLI